MNDLLRHCERIGREEGLAAGCAAALSEVDVVRTAPGRWAIMPAAQVPDEATVRAHRLADHEHLVLQKCPDPRPEWTERLGEIGRALAGVRIGVARRVLDEAVAHLSGRVGGGEPLVRKQLVVGAIADVVTSLDLLRSRAETAADPATIADVHAGLDEAGWQITVLFGAAGYLVDHPARALYVSTLVANTWVCGNGVMR